MFTSGRSGSPQLYEISLRGLRSKPKRITFEGTYNAKGLYLPDANGNIFVHRAKSGSFHIALKYERENFYSYITGLEYVVARLFGRAWDLNLFAEYSNDERGSNSTDIFGFNMFLG